MIQQIGDKLLNFSKFRSAKRGKGEADSPTIHPFEKEGCNSLNKWPLLVIQPEIVSGE